MKDKWVVKSEEWDQRIKWFLVDEGKIQYAFRSEGEARAYKDEFQLSFMLLTDIEHITHDTMINPAEHRCWVNKEQNYIYRK